MMGSVFSIFADGHDTLSSCESLDILLLCLSGVGRLFMVPLGNICGGDRVFFMPCPCGLPSSDGLVDGRCLNYIGVSDRFVIGLFLWCPHGSGRTSEDLLLGVVVVS